MSDYIDTAHNACDEIGEASYLLRRLADAFDVVGNETISTELYSAALTIDTSQQTIRKAIGEEISRQYKAANESAAATVRVALEMANHIN